jgi:hypothetical protein
MVNDPLRLPFKASAVVEPFKQSIRGLIPAKPLLQSFGLKDCNRDCNRDCNKP